MHLQASQLPQRLTPGFFRPVYVDVKGQQSLEQLGLAIKMLLAEPAARDLFGVRVIQTRAAVMQAQTRVKTGLGASRNAVTVICAGC